MSHRIMQELIHLVLEISQVWRWHSLSGRPVWLASWCKSSLYPVWYWPTVFCPFAAWPLWKAWHSHLNLLLIGTGKLLLGPLQIQLLFRLNVSNFLGLLIGGVLQPPGHHGGAPLNCLQFVAFFSIYEHAKSVLSFWKKRRANSINISLGEVEENQS